MNRLEVMEQRMGAPDLLVMLPGALMRPQHMVEAGLFEAVRARGLALDVLAVNLHALEADNQQALQRLADEVLRPQRQHHPRIWLGGISRGGHLALSCRFEHPELVDGLCLLAPYPGSRLTRNAIQKAGGLAKWRATPEQLQDPEFRLWQRLQPPQAPNDLPVFMGWGAQDRFADGMAPLGACLAGADVRTVPGAHDWAAWLPLWQLFLEAGHFGVQP